MPRHQGPRGHVGIPVRRYRAMRLLAVLAAVTGAALIITVVSGLVHVTGHRGHPHRLIDLALGRVLLAAGALAVLAAAYLGYLVLFVYTPHADDASAPLLDGNQGVACRRRRPERRKPARRKPERAAGTRDQHVADRDRGVSGPGSGYGADTPRPANLPPPGAQPVFRVPQLRTDQVRRDPMDNGFGTPRPIDTARR